MTQAAAEITETLPFTELQPYGDHFHPVRITELEQTKGRQLVPGGFGSPHGALTVTPKVDQVRNSFFLSILTLLCHIFIFQIIQPGDLDYWDYCLRKLFVQKATPMNKIFGSDDFTFHTPYFFC